jgi:hypothetical protein
MLIYYFAYKSNFAKQRGAYLLAARFFSLIIYMQNFPLFIIYMVLITIQLFSLIVYSQDGWQLISVCGVRFYLFFIL